ncbi:hypothetical protein AXG93_3256s1210 [Marchantia polymorpha subsp. ruderalis]|uniref:Uncharacterized protein n=1 Tax=Marchantia polymorpha subsp. ruderalis TaxID=1480154 RepID=A0A176VLQ2_MARPO|nr:hypothetical protein AXG93_3256s1210 [Marchantia polymorpha subsp. ruderalis]
MAWHKVVVVALGGPGPVPQPGTVGFVEPLRDLEAWRPGPGWPNLDWPGLACTGLWTGQGSATLFRSLLVQQQQQQQQPEPVPERERERARIKDRNATGRDRRGGRGGREGESLRRLGISDEGRNGLRTD